MSASSLSDSIPLRVVSGVPKGQYECLYTANIALAGKIMSRFPFLSGDAREEAYAAGLLGLWKAAHRYDKSRGYAFSTYAGDYIHGHILHFLKARQQARRLPTVSLETPIGTEGSESHLEDVIADPQAEEPGAAMVSQTGFDALLAVLPDRHQAVMRAIYEQDRTLTEIAGAEGVSVEAIRQVQQSALRRLRKVKDFSTKDYSADWYSVNNGYSVNGSKERRKAPEFTKNLTRLKEWRWLRKWPRFPKGYSLSQRHNQPE